MIFNHKIRVVMSVHDDMTTLDNLEVQLERLDELMKFTLTLSNRNRLVYECKLHQSIKR